MLNRINVLIVLVALLSAGIGVWLGGRLRTAPGSTVPTNLTPLAIGDSRSELALTDATGQSRKLSDWDGKLILLNFWATWCGPCREEMPLLDATDQRYAAQGFAVIGVALDESDAVHEYLKDFPMHYPILLAGDAQPDPGLLFGNTRSVLPYSVLIGRDGKVLAQHAGGFSPATLAKWLTPYL